jgi:HK97 family phage prohead protease
MARVNAYLYLLRNGRPENPAYVTDNDLLPSGHPKSSRSLLEIYESRQVDLTPPDYIRANAERGLRWHREGLSGDGLVERTVREAAAMARGDISEDKVRRMSAWFARHMSDLSAPSAKPDHPDYPSPGVVAHALWGGGTRDQSERAMAWAEAKVKALDSEERNAMTATMSAAVTSNVETRDLPMTMANFEFRDNSDFMSFRGYAAVFNSESEPLPFRETILPGAFSRSLRSRNNVKMFVNHNMDQVLASSRAGTLKLSEDNRGLLVEADLPPTTYAKDLSIMMRRGDVDSMSFGFSVPRNGDTWNDDQTQRTLKEVRLHEVSIVTSFPAYAATTAQVRTIDILAKRAGCEVDSIADAIRSIESGSELTKEQREVIAGLVDALTVKSAPAEQPSQKLNLLRTKLEHAYKAI